MIDNEILIKDIKKYIDYIYKDVEIINLDNKNLCFDIYIHNKNINIKIEYKHRDFSTGKNEKYLYMDDILIELLQGYFELKNYETITNYNINNIITGERINTILGWFYKCNANRLFYLRYLDKNIYDFIDIDFIQFKDWLFNNLNNYKLQFSDLTTGTINLVIKISDIPKNMINYIKIKNK